jgi:hypothetical protein
MISRAEVSGNTVVHGARDGNLYAFTAREQEPGRRDVFSGFPRVASTIVEIHRLAIPEFMIEIKATAKV